MPDRDRSPLIYEHIYLRDGVEEDDYEGREEAEPGSDLPAWALPDDSLLLRKDDDSTETGRTVVRQGCEVDAFFGMSILDQHGKQSGKVRFAEVQPELRLLSQGSLEIKIAVTRLKNEPGTLRVEVTRDAPGATQPPTRQAAGTADAVKAAIRQQPAIPIPAPPGINGGNNRVVVETIKATVTWTTAAGKTCGLSETLNVRWEFANRRSRFRWWRPRGAGSGSSRTRVSYGESLKPFRDANGRTIYAVPTQTFFPVENADACCQQTGGYAVIQFVRHEWSILENPGKEGGDEWSLDVLDSEIDRATANPPETFDPTFTHNPRGTAADSEPLVYPGPDPDGRQAVGQFDRPGVPPDLYRRLLQAGAGTEFVFHFMSFLVCSLDPGEAAGYLTNGKVEERIEYKLRITFRRRDREPHVDLLPVGHDIYKPCRTLGDLLRTLDRKRRGRRQGSLAGGYARPRGHRVAIPTGH